MHVAAILAAGGLGTRIGGVPKQFQDLGDGTRMISRSLAALMACTLVDEVVVALPSGFDLGSGEKPSKPLTIAPAGARRQDSVANALARISDSTDVVVIHDAARPFVTADLLERTILAARDHGAAIAALAVHDTVKLAEMTDRACTIRATLPRENIFLAQTPQAFRREVLAEAVATAGELAVTDESMLVERAGHPVHLVPGDPANIKVTTPGDLASARSAARGPDGEGARVRIGTGYDLHRLAVGRALVLAGVTIPFDRGLLGHSDADVVCHAVTDAVLGAAARGDIGRLFPDTAPEWKDADSLQLLRRTVDVVSAEGFRVANVDVTVIAERPRLLPYLESMRQNLASALGVDRHAVSIKGKTNEGVDAVGRGEAMACHAVALLERT